MLPPIEPRDIPPDDICAPLNPPPLLPRYPPLLMDPARGELFVPLPGDQEPRAPRALQYGAAPVGGRKRGGPDRFTTMREPRGM